MCFVRHGPVPAIVLDESQSVGLGSVAWAYATDGGAAPHVTVVAADGGGCDNPAGVRVRETAGAVTLLVRDGDTFTL